MKSAEQIACPKCGHEFEMSGALSIKLREELKTELQADVDKQKAELQKQGKALRDQQARLEKDKEAIDDLVAARLKERQAEVEVRATKKVRDELGYQLKELQESLSEKDKSIKALRQQEREFLAKQKALEERAESLDVEVAKRLAVEKERIHVVIARRLEAGHAERLKELSDSLAKKDEALSDLRKQELNLRKQQQVLKAAKESQELELRRQLDEERDKIRQQAVNQAAEAHRLKDAEKDRKIGDLMDALEEAQRKAKQGSMQTQGEVLEEAFERSLKIFFPEDRILPVPKGVQGADIMQQAMDPEGRECGLLLWETKNTKAWSQLWIPKLKTDMIACHANFAVIVSQALPEHINRFGYLDGVWVSGQASALPLAVALRQHLISLHKERQASVGKNQKMEVLYHYFAGDEFRQKIQGVVEAFTAIQNQLHRERVAMNRIWNEREKQLTIAIKNTASLYGDVQGIIGAAVTTIPALELEAPDPARQLAEATMPDVAIAEEEPTKPVDNTVEREIEDLALDPATVQRGEQRVLAEELKLYRSCRYKDLVKLAGEGPEEAERPGVVGGTDYLVIVKAERVDHGLAIRLLVTVCEVNTKRALASDSFVMQDNGVVMPKS
jgi:hypothetical protein